MAPLATVPGGRYHAFVPVFVRRWPMRQLPLPDALKGHVTDLVTEVALTDADGKVVAYLISPDQREMFYDMAFALADAADAQGAKAKLSAEQTAEILAEMRSL